MSTHNICFLGEIRKVICGNPLLSGAVIPLLSRVMVDFPLVRTGKK